jgi:hypothetical protein
VSKGMNVIRSVESLGSEEGDVKSLVVVKYCGLLT